MDDNAVKQKMEEIISMVKSDVSSIRTGRATPALVEDIIVDAYGGVQKMRLNELASITATDAQTIVISPWDKSIVGEIKKGILSSNAGFNPSIDGDIIRIILPPLTREDREKYVKLLGVKLENGKIMLRQLRSNEIKRIKDLFENKEISEDEKFNLEKRLQEITDHHVGLIEEIGEAKEKELLS